jgi:hypothetical protein
MPTNRRPPSLWEGMGSYRAPSGWNDGLSARSGKLARPDWLAGTIPAVHGLTVRQPMELGHCDGGVNHWNDLRRQGATGTPPGSRGRGSMHGQTGRDDGARQALRLLHEQALKPGPGMDWRAATIPG